MLCPCDSTRTYHDCCEPFHLSVMNAAESGTAADSPERLMRSRFSAFVLNLPDYLERTWHQSTRPKVELDDNPNWVQLQIVESRESKNEGFVHFRAFYEVQGELGMMEEKSDFVREDGQWFYLQGVVYE